MKKSIFTIVSLVALISMTVGCTGSKGNGNDADSISADSTKVARIEYHTDSAQADSIAMLYGMITGTDVVEQLRLMDEMNPDNPIDINEFCQGVSLAMPDSMLTPGYSNGFRAGLDIYNRIAMFAKNNGITIDREMLLKVFEEFLYADSISADELQNINSEYNNLLFRVTTLH